MSFSFKVVAATKAAVINKVSEQLDEVCRTQPVHEADRACALKNAEACMALLTDKDEGVRDYAASVSGSIGISDVLGVTNVSINCFASLEIKQVQQAPTVEVADEEQAA